MRRFIISLLITALSLGFLFVPSSALERESFYQRYHVSPEGLILHLNQTDARSYGDSQNWYNLTGLDHFEQATGANQPTITGALGLAGSCRDFDGDDYMQQKVYDTNQGNMTFVADGGSAEFRDDGQNFAEWETTSGNAAYMLVVVTNNGTSWAYAGASNNSGLDIDCYSDIALTTRGWKVRTTPQATPDTPASYEVLKTDFQITAALSLFMWVKPDDGHATNLRIISKYKSVNGFRSFNFYHDSTGKLSVYFSSNGNANSESEDIDAAFFASGQETWHHIGFVYNGTTCVIYGDSVALASTTGIGGIPAALYDVSEKLTIGALSTPGSYFAGLIGPDVQVFERAISAAEVQRIFNEDRKDFGL